MKLENLTQSRVKATFTVTPEEFEAALDAAFEIVVKDVKIDGFRQGKCPRPVFEKKFGVEALYDEALNVVLNNKAKEVYADQELAQKIVSQFTPNIESEKFERGTEFVVSLEFDVMPEFELPQYKGLETKAKDLVATDADVESVIKDELRNHGTLTVKEDQTIELNDTAVFDFLGTVDGVAFDGGKAENYELVIGSGQFIPGFEDQMVGMKAGETKDVNVTFPEAYPAAELAGKAAVFAVTVHEVKTMVLPELTDEFVKTLNPECNTVEDFKNVKKAAIELAKAKAETERQMDDLFGQILENTKVDLPQVIVDDYANNFKAQYVEQAKMYNIPFETFLQIMGTDEEKFNAEIQNRAHQQALFQAVVAEIAKVENIDATKEEVEAKAQIIAEQTKQDVKQVLATRINGIYSEIVYNKVVDLVLTSAKEI